MQTDPKFESKLSAMVSKELTGDADQIGALIERLTNALGLAVAVASGGNHEAAENLLGGIDGYLADAVVEHSKLASFMAAIKHTKGHDDE